MQNCQFKYIILIICIISTVGALYLTPPGIIHLIPSNPLIAPRCFIHLRWCFFELVGLVTASYKLFPYLIIFALYMRQINHMILLIFD